MGNDAFLGFMILLARDIAYLLIPPYGFDESKSMYGEVRPGRRSSFTFHCKSLR